MLSAEPITKPQTIPFLELPAEIRNIIYSYVVEDDAYLKIDASNPGKLTTTSPISTLNNEIRDEYISMLEIEASNIHAAVHDFNFDHIITFYDHLLEHLQQKSASEHMILTIHLTFSPSYFSQTYHLKKGGWLKKRKNPAQRMKRSGRSLGVKSKTTWELRKEWLEKTSHSFTDAVDGGWIEGQLMRIYTAVRVERF